MVWSDPYPLTIYHMEADDLPLELARYIAMVKRMYERMERENSWPWEVDPEGYQALIDEEAAEENGEKFEA